MVVEIVRHCNDEVIEWKWSSDNELLPSPFWTACFVVDGLLIDSGAPGGTEDLREFVESLDEEEAVKKCVITHSHEDHAGGGHMLKHELGIPVYASKEGIRLLLKEKEYPDYRKLTWGKHYQPFKAQGVENPLKTPSGKFEFEILEMPGHASDLITLIEREQQWAFTTDAVMPKYQMVFDVEDIPEDISRVYTSIKSLHEYTEGMDELKIFTSGRGIFEGRCFLKKKMEEIEHLHEGAHRYLKEGQEKGLKKRKLMKFLLKEMFGGESFVGKFTRGDLSSKNLIQSLLEWPL